MEGADARGDLVVAADEPCRGTAIAADPRGLLHGLHHHDLWIGVGLLDCLDRRVLGRQIQQPGVSALRLLIGLSRDHECREAEAQRRRLARPCRDIGNQSGNVFQRLTIDEPDVAVIGDQCAGRFGLTTDIDQRPWPIEA